jgi:PAS domain S-box-containing protein
MDDQVPRGTEPPGGAVGPQDRGGSYDSDRQLLAAIVKASRDAIWSWNTDGVITSWNAEAERLFGYAADEIIGRSLLTIVPAERLDRSRQAIVNLLRGDFYGQYETVRLRKDGVRLEVELTVSPIHDATGAIVGVATVCRDITQRREAEARLRLAIEAAQHKTEELAQSETRYRWALTAGRLVHWETDLMAGTRTWTEEAMALFGLTSIDGHGRFGSEADEFKMAVHPDDRHLVKGFYELADRQDWFPVEYRILKPDGTVRWLSGGGQVVARGADGKAHRLVNVVSDITDRKVAEDHIKFLMGELTHRSKNLLAVVQAIANQMGHAAGTIEEFQTRLAQRLRGLAASHDLLVLQNWQGAALTQLVRDQLAPFAETRRARLDVSGPDVLLSPKAAEAIGLALHELATNAIKYGALSVPVGQVSISWALDNQGPRSSELRLRWVERGGPIVNPPSRKGFGHAVFERSVAKSLDGKVSMEFAPEGLSWELSIPTINLVTEHEVVRSWSAS